MMKGRACRTDRALLPGRRGHDEDLGDTAVPVPHPRARATGREAARDQGPVMSARATTRVGDTRTSSSPGAALRRP